MSRDGFLGRWSRRKQTAKVRPARAFSAPPPAAAAEAHANPEEHKEIPEAPDAPAREAVGSELASPPAPGADQTPTPPEDLPDPESLTYESDFSAFLKDGVSDEVRKLALRKLWRSNPVLANLDGLNDYDEDFRSQMFGGSHYSDFLNAMAAACANVSGSREGFEGDKDHALSIVAEIAPRDGLEAMLATQMAAVHIATMRQSRRLVGSDTIQQFEAHERAFNKLARTFTTQLEALRKHRHGGKQTVTVQHVNVEDGGQAIVGNVQNGGAGQR